ARASRIQKLRPGVECDAFAPQDLFQHRSGAGVELVQNMWTALNLGDAHAEPGEELCELDRDRAAAQHNDGARQSLEFEGAVAVQAFQLRQLGQWRGCENRPRGDDKVLSRDSVSVAQLQQM